MRNIAIMPAKGYSRRIPNKNLTEVNGTPVMVTAIKEAIIANVFTDIVVSTDSREIKQTVIDAFGSGTKVKVGSSRQTKVQVIDRPAEYCQDDTPMSDVCLHILEVVEPYRSLSWDNVCILYPLAFFMKARDIVEAMQYLSQYDRVLPVYQGPDVERAYRRDQFGSLTQVHPEVKNVNLQDSDSYYPVGSFSWLRANYLLEHRSWYADKTFGYVLKSAISCDVDTKEELDLMVLLSGLTEKEAIDIL